MTNEEAIEILEERWRYSKTYKYTDAEIREAFDMAIKALEQESCEDAISRQAVLDAIITLWADKPFGNPALTEIKECVERVPSVAPQPKTGHWIDRFPAKECKCSVCDFLICVSNGSYIDMVGQMKYCPNCGAKMVEPQESEG